MYKLLTSLWFYKTKNGGKKQRTVKEIFFLQNRANEKCETKAVQGNSLIHLKYSKFHATKRRKKKLFQSISCDNK